MQRLGRSLTLDHKWNRRSHIPPCQGMKSNLPGHWRGNDQLEGKEPSSPCPAANRAAEEEDLTGKWREIAPVTGQEEKTWSRQGGCNVNSWLHTLKNPKAQMETNSFEEHHRNSFPSLPDKLFPASLSCVLLGSQSFLLFNGWIYCFCYSFVKCFEKVFWKTVEVAAAVVRS